MSSIENEKIFDLMNNIKGKKKLQPLANSLKSQGKINHIINLKISKNQLK